MIKSDGFRLYYKIINWEFSDHFAVYTLPQLATKTTTMALHICGAQ